MIRSTLAALLTSLSVSTSALAQDFVVQNAKVWTGTDAGTLDNTDLLVRDGEIAAIGDNLDVPNGLDVIDASGRWLTPGIIAPFTRIGIVEVGAEDSTDDRSADLTMASASLIAADGFNPAATSVNVTRIEGVTRIIVAPTISSHVIGGQGFVANTSGAADSVTERNAFVFVDVGEAGAAVAGGSRPALWSKLRSAIEDARTYPARYATHDAGDALKRPDARAFGPAVRGQQLILFRVSRASDIMQVLALKQEMPQLRFALVGAEEAWLVADALVAADVPVIIDPFANLPGRFESLAATQENAKRLIAAGVPTAFAFLDRYTELQARIALQVAGNAVGNGVAHDDALRALTTVPAAIFGLETLGSIAVGKSADLVIWDGDPLEVMSAPDMIWIDGESQSMTSRQTELRDRYITPSEDDLPVAYRR
ncbi:MAG: amidohydrolase family protein [Pseudomonadota bacterium]